MALVVCYLSWLGCLCKLVKILCWYVCHWMSIRVAQIVTAAHRDLQSFMHRPT